MPYNSLVMLVILLSLILLEVLKGIVLYFAITKPIIKTIWELQERTEEGEVEFNEDKPQIGFHA